MADKIKKSYKFSKKFYDDALTQSKWWSRLYFRLLWGGTNDNEIARHKKVTKRTVPFVTF